MESEYRKLFSHVFWIGGATDAGKSTAAQGLAARFGLQIYHYDRRDQAHIEHLAKTSPAYSDFLRLSLEERWVRPEPEELFRRMLQAFRDRFPLALEDLAAFPREPRIVAEGFGFLPELLAPFLDDPRRAIWLIPSNAFKEASMERRGKPSFAALVSDPARAKSNLRERDRLLSEYLRGQVPAYEYALLEVDGTLTAEETVDFIARHFALATAF